MHLGQNLQNKIKSVFSNPNVISSSHLKNFRNPHHTPKTSGIPPHTPKTSGILPTPSLIPRKQTNSKTEF
jgi:hypothetical protein